MDKKIRDTAVALSSLITPQVKSSNTANFQTMLEKLLLARTILKSKHERKASPSSPFTLTMVSLLQKNLQTIVKDKIRRLVLVALMHNIRMELLSGILRQ